MQWSLLPSLVLRRGKAQGEQEPGLQPPLHGCAQIPAPSAEPTHPSHQWLHSEGVLSSAQAALGKG